MKIKFRSDDQSSTEFFLNIAIIIAAIVLFVTFLSAINGVIKIGSDRFNSENMSYNIMDKNYSAIIWSYYSSYTGKEESGSALDTLAVYAESSYLHAIADRCGDEKEASFQKNRMDDAKAGLGKYSGEASKIDSMIEKSCYKND